MLDEEIEAVEKTGFIVRRIDLAKLSASSLGHKFQRCDVIWVGGGNTYYLLQEVRRSGFDRFVIDKIAEGVPYVGTSAGSLILAPNIECIRYAEEHPDFTFNLDSFDGLNVFPLVAFVHFDNPAFRDVYRKILVDSERSPGAGPRLPGTPTRWSRRSQFGDLASNYLSFAPLLKLPS